MTIIISEKVEEVGGDIASAVLTCLQNQFGKKMEKNGPNRMLKYSTDYMMTSDLAMQQIADLENEQRQKAI